MERIYDDKGNWWVIETINGKEAWVMHNYRGRSVRKYGPDGYSLEGYDRNGFDRNGVYVGKLIEDDPKASQPEHDYPETSQAECVSSDFKNVKNYADLAKFWETHPHLTVSETYRMLGNEQGVLTALLDVLIDLIYILS